MDFLEKDLEDIIFNTPIEKLGERGLYLATPSIRKRQVYLGNYGICDIIFVQRREDHLFIQLFELKKGLLNFDAFKQALGYARGIQVYLKSRKIKSHVQINLIGKELCKNDALTYLPNVVQNVMIYTYNYGFDGIFFNNEYDYSLIDSGFNHKK